MLQTRSDRKLFRELSQITHVSPEVQAQRRSMWMTHNRQRREAIAKGTLKEFDKIFAGRRMW